MLEKFHYKTPDGNEIVLPYMGQVPAGVLRRHRREEPVDFMFSLVEEVADPATLDLLDGLSMDTLNDLTEKWQAASDAGESSGSST